MLDDKLREVKEKLVAETTLIEKMIDKNIKCLREMDIDSLMESINSDENKINELDNEIDKLCTDIIALHHPEAKDLRMVLSMLKINGDLERMGDHAVNISQSASFLIESPSLKLTDDILRMADNTIGMLRDTIKAYLTEDVTLAINVCERDDVVDDLADKILKELMELMHLNNDTIERSYHLLRIAHNLERIADLSTNLAEETIYIAQGKVIKHHSMVSQ